MGSSTRTPADIRIISIWVVLLCFSLSESLDFILFGKTILVVQTRFDFFGAIHSRSECLRHSGLDVLNPPPQYIWPCQSRA